MSVCLSVADLRLLSRHVLLNAVNYGKDRTAVEAALYQANLMQHHPMT